MWIDLRRRVNFYLKKSEWCKILSIVEFLFEEFKRYRTSSKFLSQKLQRYGTVKIGRF